MKQMRDPAKWAAGRQRAYERQRRAWRRDHPLKSVAAIAAEEMTAEELRRQSAVTFEKLARENSS
jgi:hypothetical protein